MSDSALVRLMNTPLRITEIAATAVAGLTALPGIAMSLERLATAATALQDIAGAVGHLDALAELGRKVNALTDTETFQAELTMALDAVQRISAAVGLLDELPERVAGVDRSITAVGDRLTAVEPDVRELARMVGELDESIRVLAGAVAPLQGTTERLGRLVDRLPRRKDQSAG